MSEKIENFMGLLTSVWGKRHESEEAEARWLRMWAQMLNPFEPWVLDAGIQRLVETRRDKYFPTVAEVRDLLVAVRAEDERTRPRMAVSHQEQLGDPFALADALVKCQMGREAARANPSWILALHDFCRDNRRLPSGYEINKCKQTAADFDDLYARCVSGRAGPKSKDLETMGASMIRRTQKLRVMVLGSEAEAA